MATKRGTEPNRLSRSRSCTDVLCLALFLVFLGGWVAIGVLGFMEGDPDQLVYPSNSRGEICGRGDYVDQPSLLFYDLSKCTFGLGCSTPQVCVSACPNKTTSLYAYALALTEGMAGNYGSFDIDYQKQFCDPGISTEEWNTIKDDGDELLKLIDDRRCPSYLISSKPLVGRCVPDFGLFSNDTDDITDEDGNPLKNGEGQTFTFKAAKDMINNILDILNLRGFSEKVWADLVKSKWMILAGEAVGVLIAFLWIFLMRFVTGIMVWLSLFLTIGLLGLSTAYTWVKYDSFQGTPSITDVNPIEDGFGIYLQLKDTWLAFFIISIILLIIIVLVTLFLRKRISLAIALISESSRAVGSILSSVFFPLVTFLLQVVVMAWFVAVCIFLASSSEQEYRLVFTGEGPAPGSCSANTTCDPTNTTLITDDCQCSFYKLSSNELENYLQLYNIFGLFWGLCFVAALGEMVLAGAFSSWYWVLDKSDLQTLPVLSSLGRTFRYHTGTLAFGSLIIAIIKMIRLMLQYVQDKLEEKGADNPVVKVLLCLCKCCFWCLEKFMKFINRNAYILTAINGSNFCKSAKDAFSLILRNCVRVAVLDKVTDFLIFLGKLVVTGSVTLLSFWYFSGGLNSTVPLDLAEPELNYYFVPVIIITIGVYFTASAFFSVYTMAVDTVSILTARFLC